MNSVLTKMSGFSTSWHSVFYCCGRIQNLLIFHLWLSAEEKTWQLFNVQKIGVDRKKGGQIEETCKQKNEALDRYISNYSYASTNYDDCFCYFTDC